MRLFAIAILALNIVSCSDTKFDGRNQGGEDEPTQTPDPCSSANPPLSCPKPTDLPGTRGIPYTNVVRFDLPTSKEIPLVKTILIVDNSTSMQEEQNLLAEGVKTFTSALKGKNVDLYLYTTTQFADWVGRRGYPNRLYYDTSYTIDMNSATANIITHGVNDAAKPNTAISIMYSYQSAGNPVSSATAPNFDTVPMYDIAFEYSLKANLLENGAPLSVRPETTDAQLDVIKTKLASAISGIGISPSRASDYEEGLCALIRLVYDQGANSLFQPGDNVAFVILTDEDDFSDPRTCLAGRKLKNIKRIPRANVEANCANNACTPTYTRYNMRLDYNRIRYTCLEDQKVDGVSNFQPVTRYVDIWECGLTGKCQNSKGPAVTCTAQQNALAVQNCNGTASGCYVDQSDIGPDLGRWASRDVPYTSNPNRKAADCANVYYQMTHNGSTPIAGRIAYEAKCEFVADLARITSGNVIENSVQTEATYFTPEQQTAASNAAIVKAPLIDAFIARSKATFGDKGFFLSVIMRDEQEDAGKACPSQAASNFSYGTTYKAIVNQLGELGSAFSICASNYAPALAKVENFIKTIVESTHTQKLKAGEKISKIIRIRGTDRKELVFGTDVRVLGGKIEFLNDFNKDDKYEISIDGIKKT